jgi:TRAP-type C4-dicarboxylate transport system permease large subunit
VGIVIPPSVTLVVYGSIANTSIADLFIGGVVPGLLMGVSMCLVSWIISKRKGYKGEGSFSLKRMLLSISLIAFEQRASRFQSSFGISSMSVSYTSWRFMFATIMGAMVLLGTSYRQ